MCSNQFLRQKSPLWGFFVDFISLLSNNLATLFLGVK